MNSVQDILSDLRRSAEPATKTAADANSAPDLGQAKHALQQSLQAVTAPQTKTASNNGADVSAVQELTKIASDLADADETAQVKTAQLMGAAAFDGFLQRANQYAANAPTQKQASIQAIPGGAKTAAEQQLEEQTTKLAADLGYSEAENAIQRLVSAEKTAAAQRQNGQYQQNQQNQQAQRQYQQNQQKVAEDQRIQGILAAAEKTAAAAEDCFVRGYEDMHKIAEALT